MPVHGEIAEGGGMSYVAWTDKGRFKKMHAALPGEQHTACSLWLDYTPINGYRFPLFGDDKETCKRCQSVLQRLVREAS
jgi:hypothetical protein